MEKEGKEYEDKDTFLTSAYRKKLEERKKMEEELRKEEKKEGEVIEKNISKYQLLLPLSHSLCCLFLPPHSSLDGL